MEQLEQSLNSITDLQPKMYLQGVIKETHLHGAFVDIGLEQDGLVHISQLSPNHTNSVTDVVQQGDKVDVWVDKVNVSQGRIGLTMVKPPDVEWRELAKGQIYTGAVTRIESYGIFVDIGTERPGLLHIREMSKGYVRHPSDMVKINDEVDVRILKIDRKKRRIALGMAGLEEVIDEIPEEEDLEPAKTAMEIALQRAQVQEQKQRHRSKKQAPEDISEREEILTRTLETHSQH